MEWIEMDQGQTTKMVICPTHGKDCRGWVKTPEGYQHLLNTWEFQDQPWANPGEVQAIHNIIFDANLYLLGQRDYIYGERCYLRVLKMIKALREKRPWRLDNEINNEIQTR